MDFHDKPENMDGDKVFNDSVHGHMSFHPLLVKIIDTPEFQRLRNIKQLNSLNFVFPSASNNRFEHSLGTSYLANLLVSHLEKNQPELNITKTDILCVSIAGLCHDLGHGPFSHFWEKFMMKYSDGVMEWQHEKASICMLDHIIKKRNLMKDFEHYGMNQGDIEFIKDLIMGESQNVEKNSRSPDKNFLFEIVSNKRTGIDVDRWDYMLRDSLSLGLKCSYDYHRFILFSHVNIAEGNNSQICFRKKEVGNVYHMLYNRLYLNRIAYKHKTSGVIDEMMCDSFMKANEFMFFAGESKRLKTMAQATMDYDMEAFSLITDHIFYAIIASCDERLIPSKRIIEKIQCRDLYRIIRQINIQPNVVMKSSAEMTEDLVDIMKHHDSKFDIQNLRDNIIFQAVYFDYGMSNNNPVEKVQFYSKDNPEITETIKRSEVSSLLPSEFKEDIIRVIYRDTSQDIKAVEECIDVWHKERRYLK